MQKKTLIRFNTAGSVDDGKSTLIGRLLYDSKSVPLDQLKNIERTMFELFKLAKKGIALNFLSMFAKNILANEYYCNPVDILKIALTISRKVTLRHDYMPHDFTIYLLK